MESALSKHNIITTDMMEEYGLTRAQLAYFVKRNHYKRISKGTYQYVGDDTFKLYKLNHRAPNGVLSHNTALFHHGMIEQMPENPSITLGTGCNSKNFTKSGVKVFTVKKEVLYLGLINTKDVFGNPYHVYDLDRTMVDLVRSRNYVGEAFVWEMLRKYLAREDKDLEKLYKYAKVFRVDRILKEAIEKSTSFSIKLKQIRSALGKSQMTIANDLGCPNSRISYYEQGIMEPTQEELERLCALYGVNKDWLFGNSKEMFVGVIMNGKKEVAERLKELRKKSGMTQEEFCSFLGVPRGTYSAIESGNVKLNEHLAEKIAEALEVGVGWLMYGDENQRDYPINRKAISFLEKNLDARKAVYEIMKKAG